MQEQIQNFLKDATPLIEKYKNNEVDHSEKSGFSEQERQGMQKMLKNFDECQSQLREFMHMTK